MQPGHNIFFQAGQHAGWRQPSANGTSKLKQVAFCERGRRQQRQTTTPSLGPELEPFVLQQKSNKFQFAFQRSQPETGSSPSLRFSESVQSPLSAKAYLNLDDRAFSLPTSPGLTLSLHPPQHWFLAFSKQVCLLRLQ